MGQDTYEGCLSSSTLMPIFTVFSKSSAAPLLCVVLGVLLLLGSMSEKVQTMLSRFYVGGAGSDRSRRKSRTTQTSTYTRSAPASTACVTCVYRKRLCSPLQRWKGYGPSCPSCWLRDTASFFSRSGHVCWTCSRCGFVCFLCWWRCSEYIVCGERLRGSFILHSEVSWFFASVVIDLLSLLLLLLPFGTRRCVVCETRE